MENKEMTKDKNASTVAACNYCNKKFSTNSYLKLHEMIHTGKKEFKCPHCNYAACNKAYLRNHMFVHESKSLFNVIYHKSPPGQLPPINTSNNLSIHSPPSILMPPPMQQQQQQQRPKVSNQQKHPGTVEKKKRVHKKKNETPADRPYQCVDCGFSAKKNYDLKQHQNVHSEDKPFACSFPKCPYRTRWSQNVAIHERVHFKSKDNAYVRFSQDTVIDVENDMDQTQEQGMDMSTKKYGLLEKASPPSRFSETFTESRSVQDCPGSNSMAVNEKSFAAQPQPQPQTQPPVQQQQYLNPFDNPEKVRPLILPSDQEVLRKLVKMVETNLGRKLPFPCALYVDYSR